MIEEIKRSNVKKIGFCKYIVLKDFSYYSPRFNKTITAHKGFVFDAYTIAPNLPDLRPAKIHDVAFAKKKWDDETPMTRKEADLIFYDLMRGSWDKTTRRFARLYYSGVRLFSGWFW